MENSPDFEVGNEAVTSLGTDSGEPADHVTAGTYPNTSPTGGVAEPGDTQDGKTNQCDNTDHNEDEDIEIDAAVLDRMTTGVLGLFLPNLQRAKGSLNEVLHNQEVLIETLQQENAKFADSVHMKNLIQTMGDTRVYHSKLVNIKKEMSSLMDRSTKLKSRAVKLQQQKQREEHQRAAKHERELEKERMLTAKVARQRSTST